MRKTKKVAVLGVLSAGALFASTSNAFATGGPWDDQFGPAPYGCYAWTDYSQYIVTPHIWQQADNFDDSCSLGVEHVGYDSSGNVLYDNWWPDTDVHRAYTYKPSTSADGPSWYYGPWNGNGHMCVTIYTGDDHASTPSRHDYGEVRYC